MPCGMHNFAELSMQEANPSDLRQVDSFLDALFLFVKPEPATANELCVLTA
jgi:hypothetical protein